MTKILVVDDEEMIRFAFEEFLNDEGYVPLLARDAEDGLKQIRMHEPEIIFLDYRLPGKDGLDLLEEIGAIHPKAAVVFMTAFGAMDVAIKAMQLGAFEYLTKPLDLAKVRQLIRRIFDGKQRLHDLGKPEAVISETISSEKMVGTSPAMQEIYKMIGLLTTQDVTVLITGESGVGKELVARAIHDNSPRRDEPFVGLNCGAMPETLLEAEMFGYEKGAFTGADSRKPGKFEVAGGGTVFLDEIGELQPTLQVKLLRVLQERRFERVGGNTPVEAHARIMAATNKDLHSEMLADTFRKDLFYRLHLVHIHIPPLRERRGDIPLLVEHFVRKANCDLRREVRGVTDSVLDRFMEYSWPGNVRELENQLTGAMVLSRDDILSENLFDFDSDQVAAKEESSEERLMRLARQVFAESLQTPQAGDPIMDRVMGIVEKSLIDEALRLSGGNQVKAAQLLGVHRSTLRKKKKDYGL